MNWGGEKKKKKKKEDDEEIPHGSSAIILEAIGEERVSNMIPAVILDEKNVFLKTLHNKR